MTTSAPQHIPNANGTHDAPENHPHHNDHERGNELKEIPLHPHASARSHGRHNSETEPHRRSDHYDAHHAKAASAKVHHPSKSRRKLRHPAHHLPNVPLSHLSDFRLEPMGHESDFQAGEEIHHHVEPDPSRLRDLRDRIVTAVTHHVFFLLLAVTVAFCVIFVNAPTVEGGILAVERTTPLLLKIIDHIDKPIALLLLCATLPRWK